ncbi:hypothetical protein P3T27_005914 [Kitasatospora sp. MAA19]|uniref:hypothetical protein n=1 Tax=unclassified Kitasatospora TaxID=2633591 RepID=UPI002476F22C|nr:hypothetical protein [Kitasatospora sp. MAA19]MDH6709168.1 hypothetical protein [Kitasatospora sp. MAA19]
MQPDQLMVHFTETASGVNAFVYRLNGPPEEDSLSDITRSLAQRAIPCTARSLAYVEAELPDEGRLFVVPRIGDDEVVGWYAFREDPRTRSREVLYDSQPTGPDARHGRSVESMLASVDTHLDRLGAPLQQQGQDLPISAESILHRAGFVPVVRVHETYHRLPAAMLDPQERRAAVARAVDHLLANGYTFACSDDLLDATLPPSLPPMRLLAEVPTAISTAGHTRQVVDALSELTAPGDGVLDQVVAALNESAGWWEGLGGASDPHYAARLRYIADTADGYVGEIRAMRGDLADRHTAHPGRPRPAAQVAAGGLDTRVLAALTTSPTSAHTLTGHPAEAVLAAPAAAVRAAVPHR